VRPTVLLFDVDGTLVSTAGVGRRALERAFEARYGRTAILRDVQLDGMTDRAIVRAGLSALGQTVEPSLVDAILADYLPLLEAEIACAPGFGLHRGVTGILDAVCARSKVTVGLGTGNIRPGATAKLGALGILHRFGFGGFGCDHEERAEILRIGAARGAALLGTTSGACRVVVIGDTPRDVEAARAIGAVSVGVASARFGRDELMKSGATHAFDDLTDAALPGILLGNTARHGKA
jgi:phosphoglycolate phosphatase-like HAD superfamily hydrolase